MTTDDPDEIAARVAAVRRELGMDDPRRVDINEAAILSLLTGLAALLCVGFLMGIPAVVAGIIGINRASATGGAGRTISIVGIVTGLIGTAWSIAYVISLTS